MRILLQLVAAALALSCVACSGKNWQTINENGFSVAMPGVPARNPQSADTPGGQIKNYTYSVELKNEGYTVACTEYPAAVIEKMTDMEKFLDNGRAGAIASINGALTEEHPIKLASYPGREFSADAKDKDVTVTARIYWAPPRVYQVIYERPKGAPIAGDGKRFLDSFSIEPAPPTTPSTTTTPAATMTQSPAMPKSPSTATPPTTSRSPASR
jgi:hypothetical protein